MKRNLSLEVAYWTGEINAMVSSVATALTGWLTPLPEAVVTSNALTKIADIPGWLALVVAASIEVTGISVNAHYLDALEFNEAQALDMARTGRKTHKYAPEDVQATRIAVFAYYGLTGFLVAATAIYEVAVEKQPPIKLLAIPLPVISAVGTITMNRRAAFHRKQARIAAANAAQNGTQPTPQPKSEPQAEDDADDAPLLRDAPAPAAPETPAEMPAALPTYVDATLAYYREHPSATYAQAAQDLECSPRTISNHVKLLVAAGVVENNGQGVQVL